MNVKPVIALVGGIGSGKSRVAAEMARHGGRIVAGDDAGHEVLRESEVRDRVAELFGRGVLGPDGEIDRKKVAAIVFDDPPQRRRLEAVMFPRIGERLLRQIDEARADPSVRFVVLDAAVLLEAGWNSGVDWLVYVHAPGTSAAPLAARCRWDVKEVEARERATVPDGEGHPCRLRRGQLGTSEELGPVAAGLRACGIKD
jgi:dephospho-CoA kinase